VTRKFYWLAELSASCLTFCLPFPVTIDGRLKYRMTGAMRDTRQRRNFPDYSVRALGLGNYVVVLLVVFEAVWGATEFAVSPILRIQFRSTGPISNSPAVAGCNCGTGG